MTQVADLQRDSMAFQVRELGREVKGLHPIYLNNKARLLLKQTSAITIACDSLPKLFFPKEIPKALD